jgi:hypothetical protein
MGAQNKADGGEFRQGFDRRGKFGGRFHVGNGNFGAMAGEKAGGSKASAVEAESHDGNAEAGDIGQR